MDKKKQLNINADHLLCHDDLLENRRIAYVYYITPHGWSEADGGSLDIIDNIKTGKFKLAFLEEF